MCNLHLLHSCWFCKKNMFAVRPRTKFYTPLNWLQNSKFLIAKKSESVFQFCPYVVVSFQIKLLEKNIKIRNVQDQPHTESLVRRETICSLHRSYCLGWSVHKCSTVEKLSWEGITCEWTRTWDVWVHPGAADSLAVPCAGTILVKSRCVQLFPCFHRMAVLIHPDRCWESQSFIPRTCGQSSPEVLNPLLWLIPLLLQIAGDLLISWAGLCGCCVVVVMTTGQFALSIALSLGC